MAKAKKSTGETEKAEPAKAPATKPAAAKADKPVAARPAAEAAPAAKAPTGAKKAGAKKKSSDSPSATPAAPAINTSAAAAVAAALVGNRVGTAPQSSDPAKPQSAAFKQFKDNLNKPAGGGLGGLLGNAPGQKKSNQPFSGGNQRGHSQRFGADVNRSGVPRRTGGG